VEVLRFQKDGETFDLDREGRIARRGVAGFANNWRVVGFSRYWNARRPTITVAQAFGDPRLIEGTYVWDLCWGSVRVWTGGTRLEAPVVVWDLARRVPNGHPGPLRANAKEDTPVAHGRC
jgi:hypothetical protein